MVLYFSLPTRVLHCTSHCQHECFIVAYGQDEDSICESELNQMPRPASPKGVNRAAALVAQHTRPAWPFRYLTLPSSYSSFVPWSLLREPTTLPPTLSQPSPPRPAYPLTSQQSHSNHNTDMISVEGFQKSTKNLPKSTKKLPKIGHKSLQVDMI